MLSRRELSERESPRKVDMKLLFSKCIPEPNSGCWIWTYSLNKHGYANLYMGQGRSKMAHILTYELMHGSIPKGFQLDHLCRIRCCINPDHLEAVSPKENVRRGLRGVLYERPKLCKKGHTLTGENLLAQNIS
jgi:hypothetical protein